MNQSKIHKFLTQNVSTLEGVGIKTKVLLKKKKIEKISDLIMESSSEVLLIDQM